MHERFCFVGLRLARRVSGGQAASFIYKKNYFQTFNQRYFKTILVTAKLKKKLKKEEPKVT